MGRDGSHPGVSWLTFQEFKDLLPSPEWLDGGYLWPSCTQDSGGLIGYLTYLVAEDNVVYTPPERRKDFVIEDRVLHTREEIAAAVEEIMHGMLIKKLTGT